MYDNIQLLTKLAKKESKGMYISFSEQAQRILNDMLDNKKDLFGDLLDYLDDIEDNTDMLEWYAMNNMRCNCGGLLGGNRRRKSRNRRGSRPNRTNSKKGKSLKQAPKANAAKKAKYALKKGASSIGGSLIGRILGPLGLGMTIFDMEQNPNVGHSTFGTAANYALDMGISGAATGAALGSIVPIVGTTVGAVAGGILGALGAGVTSMYGDDISNWWNNNNTKPFEKGYSKVKRQNEINKRGRFKEKFKRDNNNLFHWYGDDGEFKIEPNTGRLLFILDNGKDVFDVKTNKKITALKDYKSWIANKETKASDYIQEKAKYISNLGGEQTKIDTKEEVELLIASISKDQNQIAQMTIEQQNAMIELLTGLIKTQAAGADKLINSVNSMHNTLAAGRKLGSNVKAGDN